MSNDDAKPTVIALHCSGGAPSQWARLEQDLGGRFRVIAPELVGCDATGQWPGEQTFTLSDEAAPIARIIDAANGPVHLVGHSYGGCVALRLACQRPSRIASLSLYEPAVLHVLRSAGRDGEIALAGFKTVARDIARHVLKGALPSAAKRFIECWNGSGSWSALRREVRNDLARYIPKACFEFSAAVKERTPLAAYGRFAFPILLLQGEYSSEPMQLITRQLGRAMTRALRRTVYGAGHMGPFTHAAMVSGLITQHIGAAAAPARARIRAAADRITAAA
jgi:pimeloyl-ACP methyl ester carboxylesterase